MNRTVTKQLKLLARNLGVLRPRDLASVGVHRKYLREAVSQGSLVQVGRGLYQPAGAKPTERHSIALVAKRQPKAVICLLTALNLHGLTTQLPHDIWIALPQHSWRPVDGSPRMRVVRMGAASLHTDVETHVIEKVEVQVFGVAKSVVDCFRHRRNVGLEVAIEALRAYAARRERDIPALWRIAKRLRISTVMRPYLEAVAT